MTNAPAVWALVGTTDAASALGCTRQQVGNLIRAGELPAINVGSAGRASWRIDLDDIAELLIERSTPSA